MTEPGPLDRIHAESGDDPQPDPQGCVQAAIVVACLLGAALILAIAAGGAR